MSTTNQPPESPKAIHPEHGPQGHVERAFIPTRALRALHTRRVAFEGETACNDLLLECIEAERAGLTTAIEQSGTIEGHLQRYARLFQEALADGIVTAREKIQLLRAQVTLRRETRHHTHHLTGLL